MFQPRYAKVMLGDAANPAGQLTMPCVFLPTFLLAFGVKGGPRSDTYILGLCHTEKLSAHVFKPK